MSRSYHETYAPRWGYDPITSGRVGIKMANRVNITIDGDVTGSCWEKKRKRTSYKQTCPRALFQEPGAHTSSGCGASHSIGSDLNTE